MSADGSHGILRPRSYIAAMQSEVDALQKLHGSVMARWFTGDPNRGTIRDIRNGDLYAYVSPTWAFATEDWLMARRQWVQREEETFLC